MKILFIVATLAIGSAAFSQTGKVGVNEAAPQATLDIKPNAANAAAAATSVEGLLIPRVSRLRAANMGASVPESTLVYINSVTDGGATGTTANVDALGYYYFTGGVWVKVDNTLYIKDGTLTSDRMVQVADKVLSIGTDKIFGLITAEPGSGKHSLLEVRNDLIRGYTKDDMGNLGIVESSPTRASISVQDSNNDNISTFISYIGYNFMETKNGELTSTLKQENGRFKIAAGAFETQGAVYAKGRSISTANLSTSLTKEDYIIILNISGAQNITMPNPAANTDRIIIIRNNSTAAGVAGTYTYTTYPPVNNPTLDANKAHTLYSDGTNWYVISGS